MKKSQKFIAAGIVIFIAIGFLIYTGINQSSLYYMTVPELKQKGGGIVGEGVRVSGQVLGSSINYDKENLVLNFDIFEKENPGNLILVSYKGIKPDSFKADVQVILEGKYNPTENLLKATILLVKCPSRYEGKEAPPGSPGYDPSTHQPGGKA